MYPRVKVKEQDQDDQSAMQDYKINSVLSLKDVLFLSMLDSCFPGILCFAGAFLFQPFLKVFSVL